MDSLAGALVLIFCTPYGWVGLFIFGVAVSMILDAWPRNNTKQAQAPREEGPTSGNKSEQTD